MQSNGSSSGSREHRSGIVKLNVGGKKYVTTEETLLSQGPNYFHGLLSGKYNCHKDEKGYYLLDRNGRLFEPILDYLRTGELICGSCDHKAVIREMKFYCIDAQRFTALSDDSIRELLHSSKHHQLQADAKKFEPELRSLTTTVLNAFHAAAEAGKPVETAVLLPPRALLQTSLQAWMQSKHINYAAEFDAGNAAISLSQAEYDFLAAQSNCEVLMWWLKEQHSVTVRAREYLAGFLASYDSYRHQYALEGSFLRRAPTHREHPSSQNEEGSGSTSAVVSLTAWQIVWVDPAGPKLRLSVSDAPE